MKPSDRREQAVVKAAREAFRGLELGMEHADSERAFTMRDLRRALELAYDLGKREGMS
jgi:hypothetical protein